jgi:uncharacterized membrane protein
VKLALIITVVVLVLLGVAGYLAYRWLRAFANM